MRISNIQQGIMNFKGKERNQNLSAASDVTLYLNEVVKRGDSRGEFKTWRIK